MNATSMKQAETKNATPAEEAIAARLLRLRDEMVVKNHLAGMEVKEAVHELGHELAKLALFFSRGLHTAAAMPQEARLTTYLALFDANTRLMEMESAVKAALTGAAHSATMVADGLRLKATLGRMDAESALELRRHELKKDLHQLEARGAAALKDIDARLSKLGIETGKIV